MLKKRKKSRKIGFFTFIILLTVVLILFGPNIWEGLKDFGLFPLGDKSVEVGSNVNDDQDEVELESNKETVIEIDGKRIILDEEEVMDTEKLIERLNEIKPNEKKVILRSKAAKQLTFNEVKSALEDNDYIVIIEE